MVAAKQLATADQLGEGRLGLNVVAGWNKPEYDAFGINLPEKHADRYALAQEWFDVVTRIWNHQGPFDWDGQFFDLKNVYGYPRPFDGRPPVMNAAGSGEGRNFAVRNADFLFAISVDLDKSKTEVDEIKQRARAMDRTTGVFTLCHVVCRPSRKEAEDYYQYYSTKMRPEISGTVGSVEKPNVCGIEEVKCLGDDLQLLRFANREGSRKAQVYRTEIVASESIPRLDAHTVAVAKNVAVHVRAGKFGESLWRLNRDDGAKHKVPRRRGQPDESAGTQFFQEGSPNPLYGTPRALFNPRQIQLAFLSGVT